MVTEDLLVASVADCFAITFRAIASASKMEWLDLECSIEGKLERVDRVTKYSYCLDCYSAGLRD
jgi:uncharacterized OsmC-like protein